jgi:hypothetical protein
MCTQLGLPKGASWSVPGIRVCQGINFLRKIDLQKENAPKSSKKEVVETKQNTGFINFASGVDGYAHNTTSTAEMYA